MSMKELERISEQKGRVRITISGYSYERKIKKWMKVKGYTRKDGIKVRSYRQKRKIITKVTIKKHRRTYRVRNVYKYPVEDRIVVLPPEYYILEPEQYWEISFDFRPEKES